MAVPAEAKPVSGSIERPVPWLVIGLLLTTLGVFGLNSGFVFPANGLRLTLLGYSPAVVGAVGSAGGFGYIIGSVLAPFIARLLGAQRATIASVVVCGALIISFTVVPPVAAWYGLRMAHGFATTLVFIFGESALIAIAPAAQRGKVIGFYTALNSLFFATGSALTGWLGTASALPYLLVGCAIGLLCIPLAGVARVTPPLAHVPWRQMSRAVAKIPALLMVIIVFGWLDGSFINLLGVYGLGRGADPERASLLLSFCGIGNVLLQFPIGWLADHMPRRVLIGALAALSSLLSLLLLTVDLSGSYVVVHLILLGASSFGIFTVSLIALGEALSGMELVAANSAFGLCWGLGGFAGAAATGTLMDFVGPAGFPVALAAGFLLQCGIVFVLPLRTGD